MYSESARDVAQREHREKEREREREGERERDRQTQGERKERGISLLYNRHI